MKMNKLIFLSLFWTMTTQAQLAVSVSPPKTVGSKTLVKLEMVNGLSERVESARAVCFLLNEHGKMVGQTTQWVIGSGRERPPLEPGKTNVFHFVIPTERRSTTNLAAKVTFSRVLLEGGKSVEVRGAVKITEAPK
jgi:hypothetical protein